MLLPCKLSESVMRILFIAFLCLLQLPAYASFLTQAGSNSSTATFNNSADFLPVEQAFTAQAIEKSDSSVAIRFSNADGYYLYRHRLSFSTASPGLASRNCPMAKHAAMSFLEILRPITAA